MEAKQRYAHGSLALANVRTAKVFKGLDRPIDAIEMYKELISINPDNKEYIHGLLECDGLLKGTEALLLF